MDDGVMVCRISGAFFFASAAAVGAALDEIAEHPRAFVLDMAGVPLIDSSGAMTIERFAHKAEKAGVPVVIAGASMPVRQVLLAHQVRRPHLSFSPDVESARAVLGASETGAESVVSLPHGAAIP
jgi:SulP family sulfate permease